MGSQQVGSYRRMKHLMDDAFAILRQKGRPSFFLTMTCNPEWEEIAEHLQEGQSASDRPDIVCRVFHQKLKKFKKWIMSGKSPFGTVEYWIHVIEFQKRGLPHAHILIRSKDGPTVDKLAGVDDIISCELPPNDPKLRALVQRSAASARCLAEQNSENGQATRCSPSAPSSLNPHGWHCSLQSKFWWQVHAPQAQEQLPPARRRLQG